MTYPRHDLEALSGAQRAALQALGELQARAAEAHSLYLRSMAESHLSMLRCAEAAMRAFPSAAVAQAPSPLPLAPPPAPSPSEAAEPVRRSAPLGMGAAPRRPDAEARPALDPRSVLVAARTGGRHGEGGSRLAGACLEACERRSPGRTLHLELPLLGAGAPETGALRTGALREARLAGGVVRGLLLALEGPGAEALLEALLRATAIDPLAFLLVISDREEVHARVEALRGRRPGLMALSLRGAHGGERERDPRGVAEAAAEALLGPAPTPSRAPEEAPTTERRPAEPRPAERRPSPRRVEAHPPPAE